MNDPIYTFKPGEGWVISPNFNMACGTRVMLEHRGPKAGERYMCVNKASFNRRSDNRTLEQYFEDIAKHSHYSSCKKRFNNDSNSERFYYCTLLLVEP